MKNIQMIHAGEDYTRYSYIDDRGDTQDVEITGIAQEIIDTLGKALYKDSFIKND